MPSTEGSSGLEGRPLCPALWGSKAGKGGAGLSSGDGSGVASPSEAEKPGAASLPGLPGLGGRWEPLAAVAHLSVLVRWPQRCLGWGLSQRRDRFCCQSTKGPTLRKIKELTRRGCHRQVSWSEKRQCPDAALGTAVTPAPTSLSTSLSTSGAAVAPVAQGQGRAEEWAPLLPWGPGGRLDGPKAGAL